MIWQLIGFTGIIDKVLSTVSTITNRQFIPNHALLISSMSPKAGGLGIYNSPYQLQSQLSSSTLVVLPPICVAPEMRHEACIVCVVCCLIAEWAFRSTFLHKKSMTPVVDGLYTAYTQQIESACGSNESQPLTPSINGWHWHWYR